MKITLKTNNLIKRIRQTENSTSSIAAMQSDLLFSKYKEELCSITIPLRTYPGPLKILHVYCQEKCHWAKLFNEIILRQSSPFHVNNLIAIAMQRHQPLTVIQIQSFAPALTTVKIFSWKKILKILLGLPECFKNLISCNRSVSSKIIISCYISVQFSDSSYK